MRPRSLRAFVIYLIATMTIMILFSCTDTSKAKKVLLDAGYHPIEVGGYGLLDCSQDDMYATRFKAYSPDSSRIVTGCVCQGWFKGNTIRLD